MAGNQSAYKRFEPCDVAPRVALQGAGRHGLERGRQDRLIRTLATGCAVGS